MLTEVPSALGNLSIAVQPHQKCMMLTLLDALLVYTPNLDFGQDVTH